MVYTGTSMTKLNFENIREQLGIELPGEKAHRLMSPSVRLTKDQVADSTDSMESSVLITLFPTDKGLGTLLMERTKIGPHGGQISFPGGKMDSQDESSEYTALREANEEVGLEASKVEVIGSLSRLYVPNSNFWINPFVAITEAEPQWKPNPDEVSSLIRVDLEYLFSKSIKKRKRLQVNGFQVDAPYYDVHGYFVWGATAMIISEFESVCLQ